MAGQGANLGSAFYEILPDANLAAFTAAGLRAGAALAKGINSATGKALQGMNSSVGKTFLGINNAAGKAFQGMNSAAGKAFQGTSTILITTLTKSFSAAGRAAGAALSGSLRGAVMSSRGALGTINLLGSSLHNLGGMAIRAGGALGGSFVAGLSKVSFAVRALNSHIGIMAFQMQIIGSMATSLITGPLVAAGVMLSKIGLTSAMNIQDAMVGLKALLPVGYDLEALMKRLYDFAVKSPVFAVDQVVTFARKLVGAGVDAAQAEKILSSINKIFITYGVNAGNAEKALLGISQIFQKGRAYGEELTGQIGEQLPIWNLLSQVTGKTQAELIEFVQAGKLTSEMFADLLVKMGELPTITAGAAAGVTTLRATLLTMEESLKQKVTMAFLEQMDALTKILHDALPIAERFIDMFVAHIPDAVSALSRLVQEANLLVARWDALTDSTKKLVGQIFLITAAAGPAMIVLGGILTVMSTLLGVVSMLLNPWVILVSAMTAGFVHLYRTSEDFRMGIEALKTSFIQSFGQELPAIMSALTDIGKAASDAMIGLMYALGFTTWVEFGTYVGTNLPKLITKALGEIKTSIDRVTEATAYLRVQWDGLSEPTQQLIIKWGGLAVAGIALYPVLATIGGFVAVLATNLRLLLNPWGMVVAALAGGFIYLYKTSEPFNRQVNLFIENFKAGFAAEMPGAVRDLMGAFRDLADALGILFPSLHLPNWREAGDYLGRALPMLIAQGIHALAEGIRYMADAARFLREQWDGLTPATQKILKTLGLVALAAIALSPILAPLSVILGGVLSVFTTVLGGILTIVTTVFGAVLSVITSTIGGVISVLAKLITPASVAIAILVGGFYLAYTRIADFKYQLDTFVAAFVTGFKTKILPALYNLRDALAPLGDALLRLLGYFGLENWRSFGGWAGGGLATLIAFAINTVATAVHWLANGMQLVMDKWDSLSPAQQDMVLKFAGLAVVALAATNAFNGIAGAVGGLVSHLGFLLNPWAIAILAIGGGLLWLYKNNETFRGSVDAFRAGWNETFGTQAPAAVQRLKDAVKNELVPAFKALAKALGFETFEEFGHWLGEKFGVTGVGAIDLLTGAVKKLADGFNWLAFNMPAIKQQLSEAMDIVHRLKEKFDNLTNSQKIALGAGLGLAAFLVGGGGGGGVGVGTMGAAGAIHGAGALAMAPALLGTIGLLGLVGAGFVSAYKENDIFKGKVDGLATGFKKGFNEHILPALKGVWAQIKDNLVPAILDMALALGDGDPEKAGKRWARGFGIVIGVIGLLIGAISDLLRGFAWLGVAVHGFQIIGQYIKVTWMTIYNVIVAIFNKAIGLLSRLPKSMQPPNGGYQPIRGYTDEDFRASAASVAQHAMDGGTLLDQMKAGEEKSKILGAQSMALIRGESLEPTDRPRGMSTGGLVRGPGTSISDSIIRRLSNGEFVNNAASTSAYRATLEAINSGASPDVVRATLPNTSRLHGVGSSSSTNPDLYVTVLLDGEPIVVRAQALIDNQNQATINTMRGGRTPR